MHWLLLLVHDLYNQLLFASTFLQSMTVSDYPILFELGFSAPALGQDTPATFGTFLSAVNICIEFLNKVSLVCPSYLNSVPEEKIKNQWKNFRHSIRKVILGGVPMSREYMLLVFMKCCEPWTINHCNNIIKLYQQGNCYIVYLADGRYSQYSITSQITYKRSKQVYQ